LRVGGEARVILYNRRSLHYWLSQVLGEGLVKGGLRRERSMAGVLSAGVERTSIGARPLVRVYTPSEVRANLARAGLSRTRTHVRHFRWSDLPYGSVVHRVPLLRSLTIRNWIGNTAGWYVVGIGEKS
jgi:hypothetical protein